MPMLPMRTSHTQALAELDGLKRQIKQPFMAKSTVEASIARLEAGLQAKTQVHACTAGGGEVTVAASSHPLDAAGDTRA